MIFGNGRREKRDLKTETEREREDTVFVYVCEKSKRDECLYIKPIVLVYYFLD